MKSLIPAASPTTTSSPTTTYQKYSKEIEIYHNDRKKELTSQEEKKILLIYIKMLIYHLKLRCTERATSLVVHEAFTSISTLIFSVVLINSARSAAWKRPRWMKKLILENTVTFIHYFYTNAWTSSCEKVSKFPSDFFPLPSLCQLTFISGCLCQCDTPW